MKLNHHARELKNTLEALDFRYDERESQRRGGGMYFNHFAEPEQYIKVFGHLTPMAARTAMDKARQIAGLAVVGKKPSAALKDAAREKRDNEKAERARRLTALDKRADEVGAVRATEAARRKRESELRSIASLMQPGRR